MDLLLTNKGLKKTKARMSVLKILSHTAYPLTAEEVYQNCLKENPTINLSTVYRILDTFLKKGLILKPVLKDDVTACYIINSHHHKHYLICQECKSMVNIDFCPFDEYEKYIEAETDFTILNHKFEIIGICPDCKCK